MKSIKQNKPLTQTHRKGTRFVVTRGGGGRELEEGGKKVQSSSYK